MNNPLVSIIIPIYNEEESIKRNIESVLNQDYDNLEIIIIDDDSIDDSKKILNRYLESSKNIKYIKNEKNYGTAYSRNIGLDNAKGKYIIFIDGDDWAEEDLVSTLVNKAEEDNLDMVQINYIKEETQKSIPQKHFKLKDSFYHKDEILEIISACISNNRNIDSAYFSLISSVSGKIFKKSLIEKNEKIRFKEELIISENIVFTLMYLLRAKKVYFLQRYLIHFTRDKNILNESYIPNIDKEIQKSIKYVKEIVREVKIKYGLNKEEKLNLDDDLNFFILDRIYLLFKHKIEREEENLDEKEKKKYLIDFIQKNRLWRNIKALNKKRLTDLDKRFLKYIKNAVFLKKFRII